MPCIVRLKSTGQNVDVATTNGANAFLQQPTGPDGFNFFSVDLKTAYSIRKRERKKGKLNNNDRQTLRQIHQKVFNVAHFGEKELFCKHVPKSELETWLHYVVEILRQITSDSKWINTGNLLQHESYLMSSIFSLSKYPTAVVLMFGEIQVLETISDMIAALEKPPSVEYANSVMGIVEGIYVCCRHQFDEKWKAEKIFKKLESTRILEHSLRCAAIEGSLFSTKSPTFKELLACTAFVRKSFKEGTPCGDTVRAILDGTDGHSPRANILPYLNSLIQISLAPVGVEDTFFDKAICQFCRKSDLKANLMQCSKCLQAFYCSKECQRADWKAHKKLCKDPKKSGSHKNAKASQHLVQDFVRNGYVNIMLRMVEECDKAGGLNIDKMVLELDVSPDSSGAIPLMKDPPEFKILPFAKYVDGSRFSEPDWYMHSQFPKDETQREKHNKKFLATIMDQQSRRKSTELLCVVSHGRCFSLQALKRVEKESQKHAYSQEAVEAFRSLMVDGNDSLLWEIFTSESGRRYIMLQLAMHSIDSDMRGDPDATIAAIENAVEESDDAALIDILGEFGAKQMKSALL